MKTLWFALLLALSGGLSAQEGFHDQTGHVMPNTDSSKVVKGFGGMVIATSDADWKTKWETPSDTAPNFTVPASVPRGKRIFVLIFFGNPQLDNAGQADISCDIDVIRPNGTTSTHQTDAVCFKGALKGDPHNMFLSTQAIGFVGDPSDPAGKWQFRITLKDNIRHVELPLKTSFVLQDK
jgi:hypothetical protein